MVEGSEDIGFALEVLLVEPACLHFLGRIDHFFDGAPAFDGIEAQVARQVNGAHSAAAELAFQLVAPFQHGLENGCRQALRGARVETTRAHGPHHAK